MSIWGTFFMIEDEREWIADLQSKGIEAGVIRDGDPHPDDLDAPYIYQASHVLPERDHTRGGSVDLASVAAHVRFHRDGGEGSDPWTPFEPFMRLDVCESLKAPDRDPGIATVLLTVEQVERMVAAMNEWIALVRSDAS